MSETNGTCPGLMFTYSWKEGHGIQSSNCFIKDKEQLQMGRNFETYFEMFHSHLISCSILTLSKLHTVNSTVSGHWQFQVTFRKRFLFLPNNIIFWYFDYPVIFAYLLAASNVGCRSLINWSRDHEMLDSTASRESESTRKLFTCYC